MQAYDSQLLAQQLNALCEVFDKKPVSLKGCEVWFDVLKEFPTEKVMSVLITWPKTHNKFPAPSEVWKVVNEINIADRERKAMLQKKEDFVPGVGGAQAQKFIASIREILKQPKWSAFEHWNHVLETQPKGSIGHRYAMEVLKKSGHLDGEELHSQDFEREPGQDDEERSAVNF